MPKISCTLLRSKCKIHLERYSWMDIRCPSTYPRNFFEMFYMGTTEARQANKLDEFGMKINSRNLTFKQNDPFDFI